MKNDMLAHADEARAIKESREQEEKMIENKAKLVQGSKD